MSRPEPQAAFAVPQAVRSSRERRSRARHALTVTATVRLRGPALVPASTQILDLSEDGIGVLVSAELERDRTLALDLELDQQHRIRLIGQVAWSDSTGRAGVRFFSPDHAALQEIQQWLFLNAVAEAVESSRLAELVPVALPLGVPHQECVFEEESEEERGPHSLSPLERDTNAIVSRALALTGATGAALALYEGGQLVCCATCGTDTPALGARISTDSGITGECMRFARVMYCADTALDQRVDREICLDLGIRSILALPLFAGDRIVGLLEVLSQRREAFDPGDARILDLLSRPVMGMLFAETSTSEKSSTARISSERAVLPSLAGPSVSTAPSVRPDFDRGFIEQRRKARSPILLRPAILTRLPIDARVLAATAALAVLVATGWLVMSQSKSLVSLQHHPVVVASELPPAPASAAVTVFPNGREITSALSLTDLKASAQHGDAAAQFALGARFANGDGMKQDRVEAAKWFTLAAKKGYVPAQSILGACYWAGRGVPKDLKQAYFWSLLARDAKDGISRDRAEALVARLSRSDVLEVQQLVQDWNRKHGAAVPALPQ